MDWPIANVIWPALLVGAELRAWPAIALGFVVETGALFLIVGLPFPRALLASAAMNTASTLIGAVAIPVFGVFWELSAGLLVNYLMNWGTFNPVAWFATFALAVATNTIIELIVVATFFGVAWTKRTTSILFGANAISVACAFYAVATTPFE